MKKFLLIAKFLLAGAVTTLAQNVAINNTGNAANTSAMLDVSSTTKGLLIPRMTSAQRIAIVNPATGLQVYQTDGSKGFYYFDGAAWAQLGAASGSVNGWSTTGNTAIDASLNYIGTTDGQPFIGKANGEQVFRFSAASTSTLLGYQAGKATPAGGAENHVIGYQAGFSNTGFDNHFDGYQAGYKNTSGYSNQFIGYKAGYSTTTSTNNLFVGALAGYSNITGASNHFIGFGAGYANTTGSSNYFSGYDAGAANTIGNNNHFEGFKSGYNNTTGSNNFFQGYQSGYSNLAGSSNYFSGNNAGYYNTTGIANYFSGNSAGYNNATGSNNYFSGHHAGLSNISGQGNVAAGSQALNNNTIGNTNTAVGRAALFSNATGVSNVAIGVAALFSTTAIDNNVAIGDSAMFNSVDADGNTAIGSKAMFANVDGDYNLAIGLHALTNGQSGVANTAVGALTLIENEGTSNTAIGCSAMAYHNYGDGNVAVGDNSLAYSLSGYNNTALGSNTSINDGIHNTTIIGANAYANSSNSVVVGSTDVTLIGGYTSWSNLSDGRFKKNVQENVSGLDFIKQLRPVTYTLDIKKLNAFSGAAEDTNKLKGSSLKRGIKIDAVKEAGNKRLKEENIAKAESIIYSGFVAQEVEAAANKVGYNFSGIKKPQTDKEHYALAYSDFVVPLVKAVQEQEKLIDDLKTENEQLKKDIAAIKAKLNL